MKKIINLIYKKIKENVLIRFSLILLILILINAILKFFNYKNFKNKKRKNAYNNSEKVK